MRKSGCAGLRHTSSLHPTRECAHTLCRTSGGCQQILKARVSFLPTRMGLAASLSGRDACVRDAELVMPLQCCLTNWLGARAHKRPANRAAVVVPFRVVLRIVGVSPVDVGHVHAVLPRRAPVAAPRRAGVVAGVVGLALCPARKRGSPAVAGPDEEALARAVIEPNPARARCGRQQASSISRGERTNTVLSLQPHNRCCCACISSLPSSPVAFAVRHHPCTRVVDGCMQQQPVLLAAGLEQVGAMLRTAHLLCQFPAEQ